MCSASGHHSNSLPRREGEKQRRAFVFDTKYVKMEHHTENTFRIGGNTDAPVESTRPRQAQTPTMVLQNIKRTFSTLVR